MRSKSPTFLDYLCLRADDPMYDEEFLDEEEFDDSYDDGSYSVDGSDSEDEYEKVFERRQRLMERKEAQKEKIEQDRERMRKWKEEKERGNGHVNVINVVSNERQKRTIEKKIIKAAFADDDSDEEEDDRYKAVIEKVKAKIENSNIEEDTNIASHKEEETTISQLNSMINEAGDGADQKSAKIFKASSKDEENDDQDFDPVRNIRSDYSDDEGDSVYIEDSEDDNFFNDLRQKSSSEVELDNSASKIENDTKEPQQSKLQEVTMNNTQNLDNVEINVEEKDEDFIDPISSFRDAEEESDADDSFYQHTVKDDQDFSTIINNLKIARQGVASAYGQIKELEKNDLMDEILDTEKSKSNDGNSPKAVHNLDIISSIRADSPTLSLGQRSLSPVPFRDESPPRHFSTKLDAALEQDKAVSMYVNQTMSTKRDNVDLISSLR